MVDVAEIAKERCSQDLRLREEGTELPRVQLRLLVDQGTEHWMLEPDGQHLRLTASSPAMALSQTHALRLSAAAGQFGLALGARQVAFHDRIVWVQKYLPAEGEAEQSFCERLLALGYNTVVLPSHAAPSLTQALDAWGLRVFLNMEISVESTTCPYDQAVQESLEEQVSQALAEHPAAHGIYYRSRWAEASFRDHRIAPESTRLDLLCREREILEAALGERSLIFELPTPHRGALQAFVQLFEAFSGEVGPRCTLAFSAIAGDPCEDHKPLHPYWDQLAAAVERSQVPVLPIVNVGSCGQGEGLWPVVPQDCLQAVCPRLQAYGLKGMVAMTPGIGSLGSFLDASLWMAGQFLLAGKNPEMSLETWIRAFQKEMPPQQLMAVLREVRSIHLAIEELSHADQLPSTTCPQAETYRLHAEAQLARLNALRARFGRDEDSEKETVEFTDYLRYFLRDAKRMIFHYLQKQHITLANVLNGEDMQHSFWTCIGGDSGRSIGSGATVSLVETPSKGPENTLQEKIYQQTTVG